MNHRQCDGPAARQIFLVAAAVLLALTASQSGTAGEPRPQSSTAGETSQRPTGPDVIATLPPTQRGPWTQCTAPDYCGRLARLTPPEPADYDYFGRALDADGPWLAAAAPGANCYAGACGSVSIFRVDGDEVTLDAVVLPTEPIEGERFGNLVAIDANVLAVTASINNFYDSVYVFRRGREGWIQEARIEEPEPDEERTFGTDIALSSDVLVVGAPDDDYPYLPGRAFVYWFDGTAWQSEPPLEPRTDNAHPSFGRRVAMDMDTVVVGQEGAVYVFHLVDAQLDERVLLAPPESGTLCSDCPLDMSNGWIAIRNDDPLWVPRQVHLYHYEAGLWLHKQSITAPNSAAPREYFGSSFALSDNWLIVSAPSAPCNGAPYCGAAYLFRPTPAGWIAAGTYQAPDAVEHNTVRAVAASPTTLAISSWAMDNDYTGSGRVEVLRAGRDGPDCDCDGQADACELLTGTARDCNANGLIDRCETAFGVAPDCGGNDIPDECEPDCQGNGVPDDCDIASGDSLDCNADAVPDECATVLAFDEIESYDYSSRLPQAIATGDFDLNGRLDWSVATTYGTLVYLTEDDGTRTIELTGGAGRTRDLAAIDVDGDGSPDLGAAALADSWGSGGWAGIWLNGGDDSRGYWREFEFDPIRLHLGTDAHSITLGDLDLDGDPDALVTVGDIWDHNGFLMAYENHGVRQFTFHSGRSIGGTPRCVRLGDLNADGLLDAVVANQITNDISVLLNRPVDNLGRWPGFQEEIRLPAVQQAFWLAFADFDRDGDPDVAVTGEALAVFLNRGNAPDGTWLGFQDPPTIVAQSADGSLHVTALELNGDGLPDLVRSDYVSNTLSILINRGVDNKGRWAGFHPASMIPSEYIPVWAEPFDADGDGKAELIVADRTYDGWGGYIGTPRITVLKQAPGTAKIDLDAATPAEFYRNWPVRHNAGLSQRPTFEVQTPPFGLTLLEGGFLESRPLDLSHAHGAVVRYALSRFSLCATMHIDYWDGSAWVEWTTEYDFEGPGWFPRERLLPAAALHETAALRIRAGSLCDEAYLDSVSVEPEFVNCNGNDLLDMCEVMTGKEADCNANHTLDACEPDCDGNGAPDDCDIAEGRSGDCNEDLVPDVCEPDCDASGLPDACEIAAGLAEDCNDNGVPDRCSGDCNDNGMWDACELNDHLAEDCNRNGVPDSCDLAEGVSEDCDATGVPDECELSVRFRYAPLSPARADPGSPVQFVVERPPPANTPVAVNLQLLGPCGDLSVAMNGKTIWTAEDTACDCSAGFYPQFQVDPQDFNSLRNGGDVAIEITVSALRCYLQANISLEYLTQPAPDCNRNGIPDTCEIASGESPDCNANLVPDECDLSTTFEATSHLYPYFNTTYPIRLDLPWPPAARSDVTVQLPPSSPPTTSHVFLNDAELGYMWGRTLTIPRETYNTLVAGGHARIRLEGNAEVEGCGRSYGAVCNPYGRATVRYETAGSLDCNDDGRLDECELPADIDGNGTVDLADAAALVPCYTGPASPIADDCCRRLDADADNDLDLADYAAIQRAMGNP